VDIETVLFSLGLSGWLYEIVKDMVGDVGWSTIKHGIMKFIGRDPFEKCFDATVDELMKKYPKYLVQLDVLRDLKAKKTEFLDEKSFFTELEKRGVTIRTARFLVGKLASEYQKVILEKAKENEIVFRHVVIGYLASIHPLLEKNTEKLEELARIIDERTRIWSSLDPKMLSSLSTDNEQYSIYYEQVVKTVTILNYRGDAEIKNLLKCRNGSSPLFSLKAHFSYFGAVMDEAITAMANGKRIAPKIETYQLMKSPENVPSQTNTDVLLNLKRPILPGSLFSYEIATRSRSVFPKLLASEFTSYSIRHPTRELLVQLRCPSTLSFLPKSIDFDAIDEHGNKAIRERKRLIDLYMPELASGNRHILWRVDQPVIGLVYRLHFQVSQKH
jgi:hypothetical protein